MPEERPTRRQVTVAGVMAFLALATLGAGHDAIAAADSTAARNSSGRDSTLRWQFDTGG